MKGLSRLINNLNTNNQIQLELMFIYGQASHESSRLMTSVMGVIKVLNRPVTYIMVVMSPILDH